MLTKETVGFVDFAINLYHISRLPLLHALAIAVQLAEVPLSAVAGVPVQVPAGTEEIKGAAPYVSVAVCAKEKNGKLAKMARQIQ